MNNAALLLLHKHYHQTFSVQLINNWDDRLIQVRPYFKVKAHVSDVKPVPVPTVNWSNWKWANKPGRWRVEPQLQVHLMIMLTWTEQNTSVDMRTSEGSGPAQCILLPCLHCPWSTCEAWPVALCPHHVQILNTGLMVVHWPAVLLSCSTINQP